MMTVQEAIRSLDKEELAKKYARIHRKEIDPYYEEENIDGVTCGELKKRTRERLGELIELVCGLETRKPEDGRRFLFFAYPYPPGSFYGVDMTCDLVEEKEIMRQGEAATVYGSELTDWEEVMGYRVADTAYARENLCEVMAQILYEMTWFGFTPEEVVKSREEMDSEEDKVIKFGEDLRSVEIEDEEEWDEDLVEFAIDFKRQLDEYSARQEARPLAEKLLEKQYNAAMHTYHSYLRDRELQEVLEILRREREGAATE